jgi:hypothetical protein
VTKTNLKTSTAVTKHIHPNGRHEQKTTTDLGERHAPPATEISEELRDRANLAGAPEDVAAIVAETKKRTPPPPRSRRDYNSSEPRGAPSRLRVLRFSDLKSLGIVNNYPQLKALVETQNFPIGFWLSNNTHCWTEASIQTWIDARPTVCPGPLRWRRGKRKPEPAALPPPAQRP